MSECPHADARRKKRVIDDEVHVLCDDCFEHWDADISPVINAAPEGALDERRLAGDLYELWQLHRAHVAARAMAAEVAAVYRAQLWMVKHRYASPRRGRSLTWDQMADALGVTRHRLQMFASYNKGHGEKGQPEYVFRPVQRQVWIREGERRARVEERHRAAQRALGIARGVSREEPYDITEYAERGSDEAPEQGDNDEH